MSSESRLEKAITDWEAAVEAGVSPDLGELCGHDPELTETLRARIAVYKAIDHVFGADNSYDPEIDETASWGPMPGEVIGRYRILRRLGEGGFGVVFEAERTNGYHEHVALKLLHRGVGSTVARARFAGEGQALALVRHPNIASVLDAGVSKTGVPFLAMDLIDGVPLAEYCRARQLRTDDRLRLVLAVCDALGHAHAKGVIHRDLKPANVLVTEVSGEPVPKVIDFGIARIIDPGGRGNTRVTGAGEFIGTAAYMSPEQLGIHSGDTDTRSDIYSLGVMLYEVLSGSLPYEKQPGERLSVHDLQQRMARSEPVSLTARFRSSQRSADCDEKAKPPRGVPRELGWLVMKCLEVEPDRRYATCRELSADIKRYLSGNPLTAGPQAARYRARKFIQRHRPAVAAAFVVLVALVLAAGGVVFGLVRAIEGRERAEHFSRQAEQNASIAREMATTARWEQYVAALQAANGSLRSGDSIAAKRALASLPGEHKDWEYHHLRYITDSSSFVHDFDRQMYSVRFGPAGTLFAAGRDGFVARFDDPEEEPTPTTSLPDSIFSIAISPDGELLAAASQGTVHVLDTGTLEVCASEVCTRETMIRVVFLDPRTVVVSGRDDVVRAYAIAGEEGGSLRLLWTLQTGTPAFALAPMSGTLWVGDDTGRITVVDPDSGAVLSRRKICEGRIHDIERVPGTDLAVAGTIHGELLLIRASNGLDTASLTPVTHARTAEPITELSITPGGDTVMVATHTGAIASYTIPEFAAIDARHGHDGRVYSIQAHPTETRAASASTDGTIRIWDFDGSAPHTLGGRPALRGAGSINDYPLSFPMIAHPGRTEDRFEPRHTGKYLAQNDRYYIAYRPAEGELLVAEKQGDQTARTYTLDTPAVAASIAHDSSLFTVLGEDRTIIAADPREPRSLLEQIGEVPTRERVGLATNGELTTAVDYDGNATYFREGQRTQGSIDLRTSSYLQFAVSPSGSRIAAGVRAEHADGMAVRIHDTATGRVLLTIDTNLTGVHGIWFSEDGDTLVLQDRLGMTHRYGTGRAHKDVDGRLAEHDQP